MGAEGRVKGVCAAGGVIEVVWGFTGGRGGCGARCYCGVHGLVEGEEVLFCSGCKGGNYGGAGEEVRVG